MATIISCRTNRGDVGLAMPSQKVAGEDDESSPHLNTLQIVNEKGKKSELPDLTMSTMTIDVGIDDDDDGDNIIITEPQAHDGKKVRQDQEVSEVDAADSSEMQNEILVGAASRDEPPRYLPAHLYESSESNARQKFDVPTTCAQVEAEGDQNSPQPGDTVKSSPDESGQNDIGQATPAGYLHTRLPSSSIPHILSFSKSSASDIQALGQKQLSFAGLDAALTPTIRSRDPSIAYSLDEQDSPYKAASASPQLSVNLKLGMPSPLGGCGSNLSSSVSLASFVSPSKNISASGTPPYLQSFASPPKKVACEQIGLDVPSLNNEPPTFTIPINKVVTDQQNQTNTGATVKAINTTTNVGLTLSSGPLPRPNSQRQLTSAVQPVLYSAINSLERYNAGSFDNKVMIAKARGTYGRSRAFPGVPKKKMDRSSSANNSVEGLGTSVDSGLESKGSSVLSALAGRSKGSSVDEMDRINQAIEQVLEEKIVPVVDKPSKSKLYKSKSSGNLDEKGREATPESLSELKAKRRNKGNRSVTIHDQKPVSRKGRRREKKVGVFRPSSDAYTPRMENRAIKYKPAEERASVEKISSTMGTIQRPNFRDALRRVAIILHQHIVKIERRFSTGIRGVDDTGLFKSSMREHFNEDNFATPRFKCSMVRVPMARPGVVYSMRKIQVIHTTPTTDEIYELAHQLFKKVQLSSECSIVCLIYVEKLMEVAKVPLVAETWRPIFMCGLLLASKVWQDLSSWNIEFASVYPQFSLDAINRLELSFLKFIKWDLYISSSLYAKYYFALRSLLEKSGFRDRYNQMVGGIGGIAASEALKVSKRSEAVKEEALQQLSKSM
mmetsp:Transcript_35888/g.75545  ORF Transcript_35888/g.75545 Transcript_35888/m.75545 type:complete len:838 (+) Transcript_35888:132-2645(+)|eukprot:CAMPEP_0183747502 /NCGR_PEP_ID=MMETSP0737-20130205/67296_1 /TAXON_ID=385413 /ORGANISM="Thalassiosira miniscula, Strain CCMP1093" /LENGTH=837 /DNA_ID=CAMNT_0025983215 /DNA_START=83 /DNA_END=2596 /DNA_ORIENTATION=-